MQGQGEDAYFWESTASDATAVVEDMGDGSFLVEVEGLLTLKELESFAVWVGGLVGTQKRCLQKRG